ncbi:MAG: hypothetical protein RMA76_41125 [Deltaproteobacteria bacterium]|jgi:hypothetical protein
MMRVLWAPLVLALLTGCPKSTSSTDATEGWVRVKDGVFRNGDAYVYVFAGARDLEKSLPGVAFGDASGPAFGLLGGYYAPWILAPDSAVTYAPEVKTGEVLEVRLAGPEHGLAVDVALTPRRILEARIIGSAVLAPRADRTEIQGFLDDRPSFLTEVSAGDEVELLEPRADVIEIVPRGEERWRVATACTRARVWRPRPTGSTSVFLVAVGPDPLLFDAVYTAEGATKRHPDFDACGRSATSTVTFARASGGR